MRVTEFHDSKGPLVLVIDLNAIPKGPCPVCGPGCCDAVDNGCNCGSEDPDCRCGLVCPGGCHIPADPDETGIVHYMEQFRP